MATLRFKPTKSAAIRGMSDKIRPPIYQASQIDGSVFWTARVLRMFDLSVG